MNAEQHAEFHQEVLADIMACEKQLSELLAIARYHAAKAGVQDDAIHAKPHGQEGGKNRVRSRSSGRFAKTSQIDAAETILREAGEPLRTAEIVSRMIASGFPAKDAARAKMSIFTSMTRKTDIFRKTAPGIWSLVAIDSEPETE